MEEEKRAESQDLVSTALKKWKEKSDKRPFTIVTVGKQGIGVSTLINTLFQLPESHAAFVTYSAKAPTSRVKKYCSTKEGIDIHIIDTPGFQVMDRTAEKDRKTIVELNKVTGGRADVVLYCASALPGSKINEMDVKIICALSSGLGNQIWKRVVLVITQANIMTSAEVRTFISEYVQEFNKALKKAGIRDITAKSIMELDTHSSQKTISMASLLCLLENSRLINSHTLTIGLLHSSSKF